MGYLLDSEITSYCSLPSISSADVNKASALIDSYVGKSFLQTTYTELVKLKQKNRYGCEPFRGKLIHLPRISIDSITAQIPSPFGGMVTQTYDSSYLVFDEDNYEYFSFIPQVANVHSIFAGMPPKIIKVTYKAGYPQTDIPENLKIACGMICDNAKQSGGFRSFKSRTDFNMSISFSDKDDPILSSSVRQLIDSVRLT